ncbi:hypothetical protein ACFFTM_10680 [Pseudoduganella plicata]|uniref:Ribosomal protein S3AE n=1 Tax=Pseudoduganella plicata TaxID=321984 RepID=A0A4P7BDS2_9BURK|nr:hypothetical protein [Pseudoduganella plicata]QBQ36087.1 hypothetical protein E1742_07920 [Pseudoduganella plicata]GGY78205.1 hypothetical protein GCM10007388_08810 [Pseudoduganella plicata]
MLTPSSPPLPLNRKVCPPGACDCQLERLLDDERADRRILLLTKEEEKRLIARIEAIGSYVELMRVGQRLEEQLGVRLSIAPGPNEVRTVRGFAIELGPAPGLCRKTRQAIPAAIRRCLDNHPEIAFAILDAHDLLGQR